MSSFFTTPASQRKRKRLDAPSASASKKRNTTSSGPERQNKARSRKERGESISGSESEDDEGPRRIDDFEEEEGSSSGGEEETAAERRLRLAERYLENIREEVDLAGFDAADIDRDLIAERLKEDVAEGKGKIYRHIASQLDLANATHTFFRADQQTITGVATCAPYAYTVSKDMSIIKWELADPSHSASTANGTTPTNITPRRRPKKLHWIRGTKNRASDVSYIGHTGPILCVACSDSGKFVATGGADHRLVIWSSEGTSLKPLKVFPQHRAEVMAVAFRRGTNQLFSASADRTIKTWSLNELAYVETLFGHQDSVVDVATLAEEKCVSVGSRDRTARLWKVVEESQLVFRGGGLSKSKSKGKGKGEDGEKEEKRYAEGSMDRITQLSPNTFLTGSDNGGLSLWSAHKKKPLLSVPLAHGTDPPPLPTELSADADAQAKYERGELERGDPSPRWITALASVPFSDLAVSASWDGWVRVWKVDEKGRGGLEPLGVVGRIPPERGDEDAMVDGEEQGEKSLIRGVVNDISVFERGDKGKDGLCIVVAVGKEHRLGRWVQRKGRNGAVVFEVPRISGSEGEDEEDASEAGEED